MSYIGSRLLAVVLALTLAGCSKPTSSPEHLVEAAFAAVKMNDWKAYASLTITSADIMLAQDKVKPMKSKMGYTGEVLKPEEVRLHRTQFDRAVSGGADTIDFRQAGFDRAVVVASAEQELLNGNTVPVVFYGVAVKGGNGQVSQLDPGFSVVQWGGAYRLLALNFRAQQSTADQ
jgi:hypothetical protein